MPIYMLNEFLISLSVKIVEYCLKLVLSTNYDPMDLDIRTQKVVVLLHLSMSYFIQTDQLY